MSQPLSPLESSALNRKSPSTVEKSYDNFFPQRERFSLKNLDNDIYQDELDGPPSSPFVADVDRENHSPRKMESPTKHRSPAKFSSTRSSPQKQSPVTTSTHMSLTEEALRVNEILTTQISPARHSPKRPSPIKQQEPSSVPEAIFSANNDLPTQPSSTRQSPQKQSPARRGHHIPLNEEALRDNEGLTRAIQSMEETAEDSVIKYYSHEEDTVMTSFEGKSEFAGMDDTCFSTFSVVPNADVTLFAGMGNHGIAGRSPTKSLRVEHGSDQNDGVVC